MRCTARTLVLSLVDKWSYGALAQKEIDDSFTLSANTKKYQRSNDMMRGIGGIRRNFSKDASHYTSPKYRSLNTIVWSGRVLFLVFIWWKYCFELRAKTSKLVSKSQIFTPDKILGEYLSMEKYRNTRNCSQILYLFWGSFRAELKTQGLPIISTFPCCAVRQINLRSFFECTLAACFNNN